MQRDLLRKYGGDKPELQSTIKDVYGDVVNDLIDGLRYDHMPLLDREENYLHTISTYAIRYAYELTRDIAPEIFEARRSKALQHLKDAIDDLQVYRGRSAAEHVEARLAERETIELAALEAKPLKRRSRKPKE